MQAANFIRKTLFDDFFIREWINVYPISPENVNQDKKHIYHRGHRGTEKLRKKMQCGENFTHGNTVTEILATFLEGISEKEE